ncbi:MAG: hypothetical protein M1820_007759 [Bogoriella megaspora]|nr:MAG: hypothetical protein M1820_007759 [Bogoriella megaspora]
MAETTAAVRNALEFEQTNWVDGISVSDDEFYTPPAYSEKDPAGKLLKVDDRVDASKYLLPPGTALSRILYLSQTIAGAVVPVSAFILWPYSPKTHSDGLYPVVAWAHGTSSFCQDGAPSHHKNLWQHFLAPYQIALNGYVVVATDYAGLGVHHDARGDPITHTYLAAPAHANDIVFAVPAARAAFPDKLSKDFVTIGHSQGGGATWAVAERQAITPTEGCLGCIAVSPPTRVLDEPEPFGSIIFAAMTEGMKATLPDTDLAAILTPEGQQRLETARQANAGTASIVQMLLGTDLLQPDYKTNKHVQQYQDTVASGRKAIGCPMLIVHGAADPRISIATVQTAFEQTKASFPQSEIELAILPGVTHAPALTAGQRLWMEWIADRFARKPFEKQASVSSIVVEPARSVERYAVEQNWYLESATEFHHAP